MTTEPPPEPAAQPGQWVRWRHPRLALARGWFAFFGPGPFEVVRVLPSGYVIRTASGEKVLNALWVGVGPPGPPEVPLPPLPSTSTQPASGRCQR